MVSGYVGLIRSEGRVSYVIPDEVRKDMQAPNSTGFWVDPSGSDTEGTGSATLPFLTIQHAIDLLMLEPTPTGTILVGPGLYNETVYIRSNRIHLYGLGGQGTESCQIRPNSGPSLVISNSRPTQLETWIAGGPGLYDTNYGTLAADTHTPWDNQIRNLDLHPRDTAEYAVVFAGVGAGTTFGGGELRFTNCAIHNDDNSLAIWGRQANYLVFDLCFLLGACYTHNVAGVWANSSEMSSYRGHYNVADDQPSDVSNYGLGGNPSIRGTLRLTGSARSGYDRLFQPFIEGAVDLDGTSQCRLNGGYVEGDVRAEADSAFDFSGVHITGDINLATGGGDPTCNLRGGGYLGTLTDPGSRFAETDYKGVAFPTSDSLVLVDPDASNAVDDLDLTTPFITIQAAYNAVVAAAPGYYATIRVRPGYYPETVWIRKDAPVSIIGETSPGGDTGNFATVEIGGGVADRPAIVVSEATQASLETLFDGGVANYDNDYESTLVSDSGSGVPVSVHLENLLLWPFGNTVGLFAGGVDASSTFLRLGNGLTVHNCNVVEGAYVRLGNTVAFTETTTESGGLTIYNMYDLFMERCTIQLLNLRYNTGVRQPQSGHRLYRLRRTRVWNNTYLRGISETLAVYCELRNSADPSVELFDTAQLEARDCFIRGIDAADGTLVNAEGTTITGTLQFAGATPLCTFTGCFVETVAGESATRYAVVMAQDEFAQLTEKVTPVGADLVVIEDSAAGFVKKKVQVTNLVPSGLFYPVYARAYQSTFGGKLYANAGWEVLAQMSSGEVSDVLDVTWQVSPPSPTQGWLIQRAAAAGVYRIVADIYYQYDGLVGTLQWQLGKNGTGFRTPGTLWANTWMRSMANGSAAPNYDHVHMETFQQLNNGDVAEVWVYITDSVNRNILTQGTFSIQRVAP